MRPEDIECVKDLLPHHLAEVLLEHDGIARGDDRHVEVQHGIDLVLPVPVGPLDGQPFEQLAATLKERLQSRDQERLAEPPRTGKK